MGQKISGLPTSSSLNGSEFFPVVQNGETRKATINQIKPDTQQQFVRQVPMQNNTATVTASQLASAFIFTGALTANGTFVLPQGVYGTFLFSNETTGAKPVSVSYGSGSTVSIEPGVRAIVVADGTSVARLINQIGAVSRYNTALNEPFFGYGTGTNANTNPRISPVSPVGSGVDLLVEGCDRLRIKPGFATRWENASWEFTAALAMNIPSSGGFSVQAPSVKFRGTSANPYFLEAGNNAYTYIRGYSATQGVVIEPVSGTVTSPHSTLHTAGSVSLGSNITTSAALTLSNTHYAVYYNTASGSITQSLPSPTGIDGRTYIFFKATSDTNTVVIAPPSNQGISTTLTALDDSVTYRAYNGRWRVVARSSSQIQ